MKFKDREIENQNLIENLCLTLSLGAIFTQIWVLSSAVHSLLSGKTEHLAAALILSGAMLGCCALTALTTFPKFLRFLKGNKTSGSSDE